MCLTVSMFPIRHACTQQTTAWQEKKRKENFSSQRDKRRKVLEASCIIALEKKNERICTMEHILLVMAYNGSVTVIWGLSTGK